MATRPDHRRRWRWAGALALLVGLGGTALATAGPAGAATSTALTTVTVTSPGASAYTVSFTVHQSVDTPALLAVAIPGVQFPKGTKGNQKISFAITCTPNCGTGAPSPSASIWGSTGGVTPSQSGDSSELLNFYANGVTPGDFAAGTRLSVTLTTLTEPKVGTVPVSVAVEPTPGTVSATGTGTTPKATGTPATTGVTAAATPSSLGYPKASWTDALATLDLATGGTSAVSLYVPGATFPTASSAYVLSTCVATGGTAIAGCTGVTATVDPGTTGLAGTAALLDLANASGSTLTAVTVTISGAGNPAGGGAATSTVLAGTGATTFGDLVGAGSSEPVHLVSSPTVALASTDYPAFPTSMVVGTTAGFGIDATNTTNYSWPSGGAALTTTLGGISGLSTSDLQVSCSYEGSTAPSFTFRFTADATGTLVSSPVSVPLATSANDELDCTLALSGSAPTGSLKVEAALEDVTGSSPVVLSSAAATVSVLPPATTGYTMAAADGGIFTYGTAQFYGSMGGKPLNKPVVGMAATPTGGGYWEVASDGGIFAFGNATFYGSMGGKPLNQPVVGMAATPTGGGYWEVAADGGIFAFGSAQFYGSMGGQHLDQPIVGIAATPTGGGYWEVAADGGIFSFGNATFYGSMGGKPLNKPVVGMAATPTGGGYWLVASDGGVFTFGDASFAGSAGNLSLVKPVVGMVPTADGGGYWLAAADGGVFTYGDATFEGSAGGLRLVAPVVGIAVP